MKIAVSIRQNSTNTRRESDDKINRSAKDTFKLGFQNDNNNKLLVTKCQTCMTLTLITMAFTEWFIFVFAWKTVRGDSDVTVEMSRWDVMAVSKATVGGFETAVAGSAPQRRRDHFFHTLASSAATNSSQPHIGSYSNPSYFSFESQRKI